MHAYFLGNCQFRVTMFNIPLTTALKIGLVAGAILTMGVGLYSHFESHWISQSEYKKCEPKPGGGGGCPRAQKQAEKGMEGCPKPGWEKFFVAMVILCPMWAIASLVVGILMVMETPMLKMLEVGLHAFFGLLMFGASICYFLSIDKIQKRPGSEKRELQLYPIKIVAGILGLVLAICLVAFAIYLCRFAVNHRVAPTPEPTEA